MIKQDLKSLNRNKLINWFKKEKYPGFRAEQVFNWIYKHGVDSFKNMNNLPEKLRSDLEKKTSVKSNLFLDKALHARDGTIKYLWNLSDCETVESVYLPFEEDNRHSVCISTQVGCAMNCKFCATGKGGLVRNLSTGEIIDQVLEIQKDISNDKFGEPRISNVVFMGMGEPLANFDKVLKAINILNDEKGLDIGIRKITVSTSGLVPEIRKLADLNLQLVLAVSLNAPNDLLRNSLMPINKKYPLVELFSAVRYYIENTNRRVTFEYILIDDVNDSPEQANELVGLLKGIKCHINLIPLNPVKGVKFKRPFRERTGHFRDIIEKNGIATTIRQERGVEIEAACGQLRHLKSKG